ncbi:MAG: FtsX-like permease family protein [Patescibacteria group bacterium]
MTKYEAKIPFRLLWAFLKRGNRWTLALIMFLMAIAFVNMFFVSSLFDGVIKAADQQVIDASTGHIMILPDSKNDEIINAKDAIQKIKSIPEVVGASGSTILTTTLTYNDIKGTWKTIAINPDDEKTVTKISERMIEGSYLDANDTSSIIIGRQIAGGEDVEGDAFSFKDAGVGDTVTVGINGISKDFMIAGIFYSKFIDTDQQAFITQAALKDYVPTLDGMINRIVIRLDENADETQVLGQIQALDIKGTAYSWEDAAGIMKSVTKSFLSINVLMTLVASLIAAVTIFIVIYINVSGKRQQIGILRAIGVKPSLIVWSYVFQAIVYSIAGIIVGTAIFFVVLVPYFVAYPFSLPIGDASLVFNPLDYFVRLETFIFVSIGAGLVPVLFITRIKLLNAIWGK